MQKTSRSLIVVGSLIVASALQAIPSSWAAIDHLDTRGAEGSAADPAFRSMLRQARERIQGSLHDKGVIDAEFEPVGPADATGATKLEMATKASDPQIIQGLLSAEVMQNVAVQAREMDNALRFMNVAFDKDLSGDVALKAAMGDIKGQVGKDGQVSSLLSRMDKQIRTIARRQGKLGRSSDGMITSAFKSITGNTIGSFRTHFASASEGVQGIVDTLRQSAENLREDNKVLEGSHNWMYATRERLTLAIQKGDELAASVQAELEKYNANPNDPQAVVLKAFLTRIQRMRSGLEQKQGVMNIGIQGIAQEMQANLHTIDVIHDTADVAGPTLAVVGILALGDSNTQAALKGAESVQNSMQSLLNETATRVGTTAKEVTRLALKPALSTNDVVSALNTIRDAQAEIAQIKDAGLLQIQDAITSMKLVNGEAALTVEALQGGRQLQLENVPSGE